MGGDPITYLAGTMAEEQLLGSSRCSNNSDYAQAERIAGPDFRDWLPDTEALVKSYANAIHAVAERLLEKRRLSGDEVREIVERHRPQLKALTAGQNMNTEEPDVTQSAQLSEELSTQPDRLSEELERPVVEQEVEIEETSNPATAPRLSEEPEAENVTQSGQLSEELSTQLGEPNDGEQKTEVTEAVEDGAQLSTQSARKLSTQSWAPLSTQPRAAALPKSSELSEKIGPENITQSPRLSEKLSTQPERGAVINLADFRTQFHSGLRAPYDRSKHKRSRVKPGHLIVRVDGYSIAEDEYGVCFLKVLSRKPDRTSADFTKYPYAGFFKWSVAEDMRMLIEEENHGAGAKSGGGRGSGKRRAGHNA